MTDCPLCESDAVDAADVNGRLINEHWPEGSHPDYLGLKRALEADTGLSLTVSQVKRHAEEHIRYSMGGLQ